MDRQGRLLSKAAFRLFTLVVLIILPFNTIASTSYDPITFYVSKIFLPIVFNSITEVDPIQCRWPHSYNQFTTIYYKWGENLQTPGTPWRIAFEAAISDWQWAPTFIYFNYSSSGTVVFYTYSADDGKAGKTAIYCNGTMTIGAKVEGNLFTDTGNSNIRHSTAGHETGHSQSIGHIASDEGIALMGNNPDPAIYFSPTAVDIALVNQVYP